MPKGVYIKTENHRANLSVSLRNKYVNDISYRQKVILGHIGQIPWNKGKKMSLEHRKKLSEAHKNSPTRYWTGKKRPDISGSNHYNWKKDRNLLKRHDERADSLYTRWIIEVKRRDNFECQVSDENCKGYLVIHHILGWSKYPNLRYEITNGITLCQFHHPRKRVDEQRLIPIFQKLVGSNLTH